MTNATAAKAARTRPTVTSGCISSSSGAVTPDTAAFRGQLLAGRWLPFQLAELRRQLRDHPYVQLRPRRRHLGCAEHPAQHREAAALKMLALLCQ